MNLTVEDRIALLLGRAIMRAESLQVQLDQARAELAAAQSAGSAADSTPDRDKET